MYQKKYQKERLNIDRNTLQKFQEYPWRGNIRELRHAVERAVILSENEQLSINDFFLQSIDQDALQDTQLDSYNLEDIERWAIRKVLVKHAGNISKAASELGLTRATLYRRLEKYGL